MEFNKSSHAVYLLMYHAVFVVKYRKRAISDEIGDYMKRYATYLISNFNGELISVETDGDHIHILMSLPPSVAPGTVVKTLKVQLSRETRKRYGDEIQTYLWGENTPFWTPSYFIQTAGTNVLENVKKYIESQRTDDHKRKYVKSGKYKKSKRNKKK